jgi:hypothetical protein
MKDSIRRLALTVGTLASLALPCAVQASIFGTGTNGVHADQQRSPKSDSTDRNAPGGSPFVPPAYNPPLPRDVDTSTNQVPEPQTLGLVAVGLLAVWAASRRRKD